MTATKADLALRALQHLGILAAEETPTAADAAFAEQKVQAVHDDLYQREITRWPVDVVPDYVAEGYVLMAASLIAPGFGLQLADDLWRQGEGMVVRASGGRHDSYARTQAEYF